MNSFNMTVLVLRGSAAITSMLSTTYAIIVLVNGEYHGRFLMPAIALALLVFLVIWAFIAVADFFTGLHEKYLWVSRLLWFSVPYGLLTAYIVTSAYILARFHRNLIIGLTWIAVCGMITDAFLINCLSKDSMIIHN